MFLIIICIVAILIGGVVISLYTTYNEEKAYNKGVCPKCGKKMKSEFTDSQGGVEFKCDCGYRCNISERLL